MQELFKALEVYIDERILVRTNDLEGLQIRDANRIAELESRVRGLEDNSFDNNEANIINIKEKLEDFEYRIAELECTIEDKVSEDYVDHLIEDVKSAYDLDAAAHDAVVTILTRETFKLVRGD